MEQRNIFDWQLNLQALDGGFLYFVHALKNPNKLDIYLQNLLVDYLHQNLNRPKTAVMPQRFAL